MQFIRKELSYFLEYLDALEERGLSVAESASAGTVRIMSIHKSKGLEFPVVFLCGLSEGIFPGKRADTREKLEEERRLAYVAFTRAKDRLFLSDAAGTNYDGTARCPSRFLFNAERENLDYVVELRGAQAERCRLHLEIKE